MKLISSAVGAVMAAAGLAKLGRYPAYEDMVRSLDWTAEDRERIGAAELAGGVLMLLPGTRRLGAGVVLAASGAALTYELRANETQLAGGRAAVMAAAILVCLAG